MPVQTHSISIRNRFMWDTAIPLAAGIVIYWLFRGNALFKVTPVFSSTPCNAIFTFIIYSLPDGLWLYALLGALNHIWLPHRTGGQLWLLFALSASLGSEVAQLYRWLPGTFDMSDIIAYMIFSTIFFIRKITTNKNSLS